MSKKCFVVCIIFICSVVGVLAKSDVCLTECKVPSHLNDKGMFSRHYEDAYDTMTKMTLDEKIGQILLVRLPNTDIKKVIRKYKLGGFVFYRKDIEVHSKNSLSSLINKYNAVSSIPLIFAIDEEGGSVVRLSCNKRMRSSAFMSPQNIYKENGYEGITEVTREMCDLLGGVGFNVNLAPVADVSTNPSDYIYHRSFGKSAKDTAEFIKCVINSSKNTKVSFTIKHFPGYGSNNDTHKGVALDDKSLDEFKSKDLLPFKSGINVGADSIMVSHNIIACLDSEQPASLSKEVHKFARGYMNFTGIIMTDNIDMKAVRNFTKGTGVVEAILAGNDIVMVTDYKTCIKEIKDALKKGMLEQDILDRMVFRVLAWKYYKGMLK